MLSRAFLFLFCTIVSTASSAAIVSYNYTGVLLGETATVTGTFGYDNGVADALPGEPGEGLYTAAGFWTGSVNGGPQDGATFNFRDLNINVFNDDVDFGDGLSGFLPTSGSTSFFDLEDEDGTVFSDDSLPMLLTLADFEVFEFSLGQELGISDLQYTYEFDSISAPTVVPVPPAIWLFGSALMGFVAWSRKKNTT